MSDPWNLLDRIQGARTIVDLGCGTNASPISKQVKEIECDYLLSVDAYQQYLDEIRDEDYKAASHEYRCGKVTEVVKNLSTKFDLALCLDIVEHVTKDEAIPFLYALEQVAERVLIWIPIGHCPVKKDPTGGDNHDLHTHKSTWTARDLEALSYNVEVFEDFHTPMFGFRVDAAWAQKSISCASRGSSIGA